MVVLDKHGEECLGLFVHGRVHTRGLSDGGVQILADEETLNLDRPRKKIVDIERLDVDLGDVHDASGLDVLLDVDVALKGKEGKLGGNGFLKQLNTQGLFSSKGSTSKLATECSFLDNEARWAHNLIKLWADSEAGKQLRAPDLLIG
jgi:hypothetical protein